jgi:hypothetical protein
LAALGERTETHSLVSIASPTLQEGKSTLCEPT